MYGKLNYINCNGVALISTDDNYLKYYNDYIDCKKLPL